MADEQAQAKSWGDQTKQLGDSIVKLTLMQAKELADYLKEVYGIEPAAGGAMMMAGPAAAAPAAAAEEKTSFNVILAGFGANKIQVIKVVRELTSLGLKEAKEMVDGAPATVKTAVPKEEAEAAKAKLVEQGAVVELK